MLKVYDARFVVTAVAKEHYPQPSVPEVAFVGRSNVGKSSMINALVQRRKLVRVSNTPGRTRALNFFEADVELDGDRRTFGLCDLPGYGFAKVSKSEKGSWDQMITTYLKQRAPLRVIVAIIDAEVGPTADDVQTLDFLSSLGEREILVVATKIDRVPKAQRKPRLWAAAEALELDRAMVLPFSATEHMGIEDVWFSLWPYLRSEENVDRP